jgi:two-component system sensor histidine kinase DegS
MIERLLDTDPPRAREEAQRLREAAVSALGEVRRFVFETYPSVLEDLGLIPTLRRYLQTRSDHGSLRVELSVDGEERRLANAAELALFRFVQEGLEAATLHPEMREVAVRIAFRADMVEATVSGRPAIIPAQPLDGSVGPLGGMAGLQARLSAVGGELSFAELPDQGAALIARIPS